MAELDKKIADLEARVAKYETELDAATSGQEKSEIRQLLIHTLKLLDEKKALTVRAKLSDGIPLLQQFLTLSPPYVPSEKEHASCRRSVMDFPFLPSIISEEVLNTPSRIWRDAKVRDGDGGKYLLYCSAADIVHIVRIFMKDVALALNLDLRFAAEVTIKEIRPDLCVLVVGKRLVGVVEVKKPNGETSRNVLLQPTVLGELLDQMLLVEGFYGMGPVIGILTTAEEWLISWFPADNTALAHFNPPKASFTTPVKPNASTMTEAKRHSPTGGTPSQQRGTIHFIDEVTAVSLESDDDNVEISDEMDRILCTTGVMNIYEDPSLVLRHLCGAFELMSKAHFNHAANLSRCLLKFHKGIHTVTFHPVSYDVVYSKVDFDKYPSSSVKTLVALEDLGRGSTGKAWLCVTLTKPRSACCVLKFDNDDSRSAKLNKEREMWHLLYPEFAHMVKVEQWSGADALVMPHFSSILESEREQYRDELIHVLTTRFFKNGKVHNDVRWRNIGKYRHKDGEIKLVVYDLYDVVDYNVDVHHDWIEKAVLTLFGNV